MTPNKLLPEELTWPEVEQSIAAGYTTIVVAAETMEQHGLRLGDAAGDEP